MKRGSLFILAAMLGMMLPTASAEAEPVPILQFTTDIDVTRIDVPLKSSSASASVPLIIADRSIDNPTVLAPGAEQEGQFFHQLSFVFTPDAEVKGWSFNPVLENPLIKSGQQREFSVGFTVMATAETAFYSGTLNITLSGQGRETSQYIRLTGYTPGLDVFNGRIPRGFIVEPEQILSVPVLVRNQALLPRLFSIEVTSNPCNLDIRPPTSFLVPTKTEEEFFISVKGPTDKIWYRSESCTTRLEVFAVDNPSETRGLVLAGQVSGWYFDPAWGFWGLGMALVAIWIIWVAAMRKARLEEEILGKPQKPWHIPVERVYLEHLERKDARAAYVVRHFLMEEEYASSLLWYKSYKAATKGNRAKERLVVRQEHKYERFKRKWAKRIAHPPKAADRYEAKLQRKLDRQARGDVKAQRRKWAKLVDKLEVAADKKHAKAMASWEKASAKAEKKGLEAPSRPKRPDVDLPPEPSMEGIRLADHKWNKKAQKFRKKMLKRQGDLEVKFEKKEARLLAKIERKVSRVARKLDDPEFLAEHPVVGSARDA